MKVKVIKRFKDKYTNEVYNADSVLVITKERFEEILTVGPLVEKIAEPAKKSTKKKKTDE